MAKAAIIGVGKLGFPVALAWASKGHNIVGYDVSPQSKEILATKKYPHIEPGCQRMLDAGTSFRMVDTIDEAVAHGDLLFVAVQTPHGSEYEGVTRMPEERADFDYTALKTAVSNVVRVATQQSKNVVIVVISTCLPGTCDREIKPLLNEHTAFVYSPLFIAQGTVVEDSLKPEFVLLGQNQDDSFGALQMVHEFFKCITDAPHRVMSVASAELTKVSYNCYLGLKILTANAIMEIAHKTGANCDDVTDALAVATDRIISPKYMRSGMGDGGGCHCRDAIALSWLANKLDLSTDIFGDVLVHGRERQTEWLAKLCVEEMRRTGLFGVVLGKAYKRGTNLTVGSPAILLRNILEEVDAKCIQWDPHVDRAVPVFQPSVFIVATDHDEFYKMDFPAGSVIIDPWGKMKDREGVKVVRVGRK